MAYTSFESCRNCGCNEPGIQIAQCDDCVGVFCAVRARGSSNPRSVDAIRCPQKRCEMLDGPSSLEPLEE